MFSRISPSNVALPGERARLSAARWVLAGYTGFAILGCVLHVLYRRSLGQDLDLVYLILLACIGLAALIGVFHLRKSLAMALLPFAWATLICITGLLVYELRYDGDYAPIILMFHVGIFTLGLILGFRPAIQYATLTAIILLLIIGIIYGSLDEAVLFIALAYASALPSKVVERLIAESTDELAKVNDQLRSEIDERQRVEAELRRHREHLEDLVRNRTIELEARNEELDAFAHTVAHDLKSPLTTLVGFAALLESQYSDITTERLHYLVQVIGQVSRKMANIVDELLLLASVRELDEFYLQPLDMGSLVADAQARLADLIAEHQAELVVPDTWPTVWSYGPWIEEVWVNYLSNAIKYGGHPPQVQLGVTEERDGHLCFWVKDNGIGLTPEEQAQLFTPFTRLGKVRVKGYGLGLSIVRRIVDKLNGRVGVQSSPKQGSCFFFTLPQPTNAQDTPAFSL